MSYRVYCTAALNYAGPTGSEPVETEILDARSGEPPTLQREGFELERLPSSVRSWDAPKAFSDAHGDEVAEWATRQTGCGAVLFYPPVLRNPSTAAEQPDFAPIEAAHSDYTEAYADMIRDRDHPYHQVLAPSMRRAGVTDDDVARCHRVLTLQLWRNIGPELMDHPLAVCDGRTLPRSQLAPVRIETYGGLETNFDAFVVLPPNAEAENRWYTFPEMNLDEVLVFRAFDSELASAEQPFWTPHTAFRDPHSIGSARHSVEMRAICLFW